MLILFCLLFKIIYSFSIRDKFVVLEYTLYVFSNDLDFVIFEKIDEIM